MFEEVADEIVSEVGSMACLKAEQIAPYYATKILKLPQDCEGLFLRVLFTLLLACARRSEKMASYESALSNTHLWL